MSFSFVLGRAGAGKTWGCLAAMAEELRRSPRGLPLLLLVPEQATALLERRLATWPGLPGGMTRARVFSFQHLAREAFVRAGGAPGRQLGEAGRVMLLRGAMLRRQGELSALGASAAQPGVAETVSRTLLEFQRYGWSLADLEGWIAARILEEGEAGLSVRKARDLAILWRDYEAALAAGGWEDQARLYERAAAAIRRSAWLERAAVWIDGFASFTSLETMVLEALLEKAERVTVALCLDPGHLEALESPAGRPRPRIGMERLFENMEATYLDLRDRLRKRGLPEGRIKVVRLPAAGQATRAEESPALAHLEAKVLGRLNPEVWPDAVRGSTPSGSGDQGAGNPGFREYASPGATQLGPHQGPNAAASNPLFQPPAYGLQPTQLGPHQGPNAAASNPFLQPPAYGLQPFSSPPIELIEASDRRAEVEAVARRIATLCRREEVAGEAHPLLAWREVAVLARDLAPYEIHLREVFGAFGIPYFLDRPRSVQGHPLTRSILSALGVLRSGWAGGAVLHHLKSGLAGLRDEDAAGAIENAIRATDPRGARWMRRVEADARLGPAWREAAGPLRQLETELNDCGLRIADCGLKDHNSQLTTHNSQPSSAARAIWSYLEAIGAAERMEAWIEEARGRGAEETVQIHEQAWEQTVAWLEEFEKVQGVLPELLGRGERTARERLQDLIELIEAGLASTQARLVPPTLNQVTVGAVDRSRTPEVKAAFVVGMNEGEFPRMWQPEAILGDEERERLTRDGRRLGPDSRAKRLQEHFLAYIALTRPAERLVLSRPQVDDEGRVCEPSPYYKMVRQCFPAAPVWSLRRCGEGEPESAPLRPEEWALRLSLTVGRDASPGQEAARAALAGQAELRARLAEIVAQASCLPAGQAAGDAGKMPALQLAALELAHARLIAAAPARLDAAAARAFWGEAPTLPVTALEIYGECPFKFFAGRMLRLEEREEAALSIQELGTLRHEVLDRLFHRLKGAGGLNWGTVEPARADRLIDEELARVGAEETWRGRLEASALGTLALATAGEDLKLFVRALYLAGRRCRFAQVESEWGFGAGGELTVEAGGRKFAIRGKIDRIDVWAEPGGAPIGILIDYKSGRRSLSLARMLEGIDLQLPVYALAWRGAASQQGRAARIGGVFYWPLTAPVREAEAGEEPGEAVDGRWFQKARPSGIFCAGIADALDGEVAPEGKSLAFGFRKTKDGKLHRGDQGHWPEEAIEALLRHEARVLEMAVGRIAEGRIEIQPYGLGSALACDYCAYGGVCRRADPAGVTVRWLAGCKREEALERIGARG